MEKRIDINCDLGEWKSEDGIKLDEAIMPYISSCNIACGGHIGDKESILTTIKLAKKHDVAIGAHPAYPDRENFGRVVMNISHDSLQQSLKEQLLQFIDLTTQEGATLHHIKPHGALYNHIAKDEETASVVLTLFKSIAPEILIYLPDNSISSKIAHQLGLNVVYEVFADRAYEDDLSLRSRSLEGAVLFDEHQIITQLRSMIFEGKVLSYSGLIKAIKAQTICLHSDTPGAAQFAKKINEYLTQYGVEIIKA